MSEITNGRIAELLGAEKGEHCIWDGDIFTGKEPHWTMPDGRYFEEGTFPDFHTNSDWTGKLLERLVSFVGKEIKVEGKKFHVMGVSWFYPNKDNNHIAKIDIESLDIDFIGSLCGFGKNINTAIIGALCEPDKEK